MKLILTRHGETEENTKKIIQGQSIPGTLTERGKQQARKLAQRLQNEHINIIYSSDLGRAANTTKEIVKLKANIPVEYVKDLRERNFGQLEGRRHHEYTASPQENQKDSRESLEEMQTRAQSFLHRILHKHKNETVLFVSHGGFNLALIATIHNQSLESIDVSTKQKNTAVSIFEIDEDKNHRVLCMNCVEHLEKIEEKK